MTHFPGREARLKPQFAHLYPAITAGHWDSAAVLADRMVAWLLRNPKSGCWAVRVGISHCHYLTFEVCLKRPALNVPAIGRRKAMFGQVIPTLHDQQLGGPIRTRANRCPHVAAKRAR